MTSILKEEGGTKKADEGTDKLREWDSDKRVQKSKKNRTSLMEAPKASFLLGEKSSPSLVPKL